jgi:hypothetical protein
MRKHQAVIKKNLLLDALNYQFKKRGDLPSQKNLGDKEVT